MTAIPVGPVVYYIYVNGVLDNSFALDTELRQAWGTHDLFFLRIEVPRTNINIKKISLWPDNAAVRIVWGRKPADIQTWYGYVNHHTVDANADSGSKAMQITYTLIGTSKPMNTDVNKTWGEVTPTYIARTIAQKYGLRTVVTKTNWILPYEIQANESDFQFLNRIGLKVGYRFWVSGGTLYFIDPAVILAGSNSQGVPKYYMDKTFIRQDTIREFHVLDGDNVPGATKTKRSIYGVDKNSGQPFAVVADGTSQYDINEIKNDRWETDLNQAQNIANAWQSMSQWWQSATAELYGNSFLYPGKVVYLDGIQMPTNKIGYWIVASADHVMKTSGTAITTYDKYITRVELLKNTENIAPLIKNTTQITPEFNTCVLQSGKWIATSQPVIYDGTVSV